MAKCGPRWGIFATGLMVALVMAGCGDSEPTSTAVGNAGGTPLEQLYAAAQKEGEVAWQSPRSQETVQPVIEAFEKAYPGVKVKYISNKNSSQIQKLQLEQAGRAVTLDLGMTTGSTVSTVTSEISEVVDWPKYGVASADLSLHPNLMYSWASTGIWAYNTERVPAADVPKSLDDLLKPQWANKGMLAVDTGGSYTDTYVLNPELGGIPAAVAYTEKLAAQKPTLTANGTENIALLTSGQVALTPTEMNLLLEQKHRGAPVALAPLGPAGVSPTFAYVPKGAPHPNAGTLLGIFLSSPEGQQALVKVNSSKVPLTTDCSAESVKLEIVKEMCDAGLEWEAAAKPEDFDQLSEKGDQIAKVFGVS
ncbi:ABC transporter substrate-binding protein [Phytohabitans sp. ZYX-F-186]|uniref:ABC transporter substrate-binding protein n=1 Tax=Phytohabitans maris TaxID=3071409 RepID=A0ABU0ZMR0_9ACTN|nr:ABC transporter substrate-binding protein [Phytohabitans sp. ZYX-F-186]MDQ7907565.1 ABC transporter substrate-binding protein [Phytohabitans sp. ZYX-F-186]